MKRYVSLILCILCLGLTACQVLPVEPEAVSTPEPTERPAAPEYSLCLILEDGNTRRLPLTPEANERLRDLIETADPSVDSAEGSADLCFVNDASTIYLNSEAGLLTLVESVTEQGVQYSRQSSYALTQALDPSILPEWDEPYEEVTAMVTLQDLIDAADPAILEAEGVILETLAYEGNVPQGAGNRCTAARGEDGTIILQAKKLNLKGEYEIMTVQEVKQVDDTLVVSVAVVSDAGTPVTVTPSDEILHVWFVESGAFMDILDLEAGK